MKTLFFAAILMLAATVRADMQRPAIQLVMDDSGVLLEAQDAQHYKLLILSHIRSLAARRSTSEVSIDVISTSLGRTVWSGTPMNVRRYPERAQDLVDAIKIDQNRCNNLPGAFMELRSNLQQLERSAVRDVHIVVFSSLINTPRPCSDDLRITLPQLPPLDGDIVGVLTSSRIIKSISFYWVSPHQKRVWEEFLAPVFKHAEGNEIRIDFLDVERSKRALQSSPFDLGEGS